MGENWLDLQRDANNGIETLRAHFKGHAYDPHWHDSYLLGFTESGVQQFNCRRKLCTSTPGGNFLLAPGEVHDGRAPEVEGFTYRILYIPSDWLNTHLRAQLPRLGDNFELVSSTTLIDDRRLTAAVASTYVALHGRESAIVREACLDNLLQVLPAVLKLQVQTATCDKSTFLAEQARAFLHANLESDVNLALLAQQLSSDRYRITRAFKRAFHIAPHAYLVQLRLNRARQLLSLGHSPTDVAARLCFADQSHLGRWFKRAYQLSPADYAARCRQR